MGQRGIRRRTALLIGLAAGAAGARSAGDWLSGPRSMAAQVVEGPPADAEPNPLPALLAVPTPEPPGQLQVAATPEHPAYSLYVPRRPASAAPRTGLLVLHGMGGDGPGMAAGLLQLAQEQDWVVIAPTVGYGEWRDPAQLTREVLRVEPQLKTLLNQLSDKTGVALAERLLVFGFSRGAQAALRFTLFNPDRVRAVAACSAGTYTLPLKSVKTTTGGTLAAPLPFGVADIEQQSGRTLDQAGLVEVRHFIGVGARDNRDGDVPRQWDPFVGNNRVERAQRFAATLTQVGCRSEVSVVPDTGHELTPVMIQQVSSFLASAAPVA